MSPGTTVWLFWLFSILCPLAQIPWSFSPSLYVCHLICVCVGCALAGELSSCLFAVALVPDASAEKVTAVAPCPYCHYLCYTLRSTPVLSLAELVNCFWSSVCPSNKKIRQKMPVERSFTLVLMLLWRKRDTPQEDVSQPAYQMSSVSWTTYLHSQNYGPFTASLHADEGIFTPIVALLVLYQSYQ